jgi:hypothetical protein
MYLDGYHDGLISSRGIDHPVLDCTEIAIDSAYYLYVRRDLSNHGKSHQFIHIPHSSVVVIHHYADEGSKPFGFIPTHGAAS